MVESATVERQRVSARRLARSMEYRRGMGAPVRRSFLISAGDEKSPMGSLMSGRAAIGGGGGRGGRTRLGLYLTLLWVLSGQGSDDAAPHSSTRPWRFWAELVGLDEPDGAGTRAVRAAARELHERGLVQHTPSPDNQGATIQLLREDGTGTAYTIPNPRLEPSDRYRRVPESLWTDGRLSRLTGPEIAMYMVALDLYRSDQPSNPLIFRQPYVRDVYSIGDSSRRAGLSDLVDRDALTMAKQPRDNRGDQLGRLTPINVYAITPAWLPPEPRPAPESSP